MKNKINDIVRTEANHLLYFENGQAFVFDSKGNQICYIYLSPTNEKRSKKLLREISMYCSRISVAKWRDYYNENVSHEEFNHLIKKRFFKK